MAAVRRYRLLLLRLRASSLIEVIAAMLILSMVFGLAMVIYLNVQRAGVSARRVTCLVRLDAAFAEATQQQVYTTREIHYDDLTVYQEVKQDTTGLTVVLLEGRDMTGKLIATQKHLVYAPEQTP
jgi:hypothetical protein